MLSSCYFWELPGKHFPVCKSSSELEEVLHFQGSFRPCHGLTVFAVEGNQWDVCHNRLTV